MKPGYKTTEFWIALGSAAFSGALGYMQTVQAPWAIASVTIITTVYTLIRGALKSKSS